MLVCCFSIGYTPPPPSDDDDPQYSMTVLVNPSCDGNVVSATAKGDAYPGAHVSVKDVSTANLLATGETDANGQFVFDGCGMKVDVKVTSEDYDSETVTQELLACAQCGGTPPVCTQDSECAATGACSQGECVSVQCECGKVQNHQCVKYACCQDAQCSSTQSCVNNVCKEKSPEESDGCSSNGDCTQIQYCYKSAAAANTGTCKDVPSGDCGEISNHAFVAYGYECGTETGCPSCQDGYECTNHKCVQGDVTCPAEGVVGATQTCGATENNQPCANCDYVVTDPSGKNSTGTTDQNGSFTLPLGEPGTYKVALLKDGKIVKIIEVRSMPKAGGEDTGKPAAAGGDMMPFILGGVLVLVLVAAAIFFWRGRAAKT
jgi:hypothetical protein